MKKTHIYNNFTFKQRLVAITLLITFVFLLLGIRLTVIQLFNSENLLSLAVEQWSRSLPIKAERGTIYDRNGEVLALSYSTYDCYVRPSEVKSENEVAFELANILGLDYYDVLEKTTNYLSSEHLIKMQIEKDVAARISEKNLVGVYLTENTKRYYPNDDMLSQILGYTTIDNIGQTGLELYFDEYLKGVDGESISQTDINGRELNNTLSSYIPAIPGYDIHLTIDANIQRFADSANSLIMENEKPKSSQIIVMDPDTGEILANSILPGVNLNDIPRDDIAALNEMSKNLTITDVYEPGSTFKVLTTATALEHEVVTLDTEFYDPGYRMVDSEKIKCWKHTGHGHQTLIEGLNNSCNSVFVDLALLIGEDRMYQSFDSYGFGEYSDIDFFGESAGIIMNEDSAKNVDIARMGFGQAIAVTPLQEITAIASVVNGGNLMTPYYTKKIESNIGEFSIDYSPNVRNTTISEETSNTMNMMMEAVIEQASGYYAFLPGYRVGGKTGTSQKYIDGAVSTEKFVSSFVGTFPADDPEYIILVVVDEPSSGNYFGSIVATPYAKLVIEDIIDYKNYLPTEEISGDELSKVIEMPNLVGRSLSSSITSLGSLGLQVEVSGEGGTVTSQYPSPGEMVFKNAITVLNTG